MQCYAQGSPHRMKNCLVGQKSPLHLMWYDSLQTVVYITVGYLDTTEQKIKTKKENIGSLCHGFYTL